MTRPHVWSTAPAIRERESWRMLADRLQARVAELEAAQLSRAVQIGPPGRQTERKCTERERQAASGVPVKEVANG